MPYWLAVIATLLLLAVVVYLLTNLIAAVNRVEKATRRVARLVDRPRRERAAVEQEIEKIHRAIKATVASSQDMARLEELEEKARTDEAAPLAPEPTVHQHSPFEPPARSRSRCDLTRSGWWERGGHSRWYTPRNGPRRRR